MSNSVVAKRYALAVFNLAKEQNQVDAIQQELVEIQGLFRSHAELQGLLSNPRLSMKNKKELVVNLFGTASTPVQNALLFLLEKHRMNEVVDVINQFVEFANADAGVAEATVYSTRALTAEEQTAISTTFAKKVGRNTLRIENIIDSTLLGGIRVQIGNRIFDGSLEGRLDRLKRQLIS